MGGYRLDFDPGLVEEAVLRAIEAASPADRRSFRSQRDPLYEVGDEDRREAGFRELHGCWLTRLGLGAVCRALIEAEPAVVAGTGRGLLLRASSPKREHADLRDERRATPPVGKALPVLTVALCAETLANRRRLEAVLGRELVFVSDLLDARFGFRNGLDEGVAGGGLEKLIVHRYRVLWETSVDGRLAARGRLPPASVERRRQEFLSVFGMLGEAALPAFERHFHDPRPTHRELADFARDPRAACGLAGSGLGCPVCGMPSFRRHPDAAALPAEVLAAIRVTAPGWRAEQGLCQQCADLFAARSKGVPAAGVTAIRA